MWLNEKQCFLVLPGNTCALNKNVYGLDLSLLYHFKEQTIHTKVMGVFMRTVVKALAVICCKYNITPYLNPANKIE